MLGALLIILWCKCGQWTLSMVLLYMSSTVGDSLSVIIQEGICKGFQSCMINHRQWMSPFRRNTVWEPTTVMHCEILRLSFRRRLGWKLLILRDKNSLWSWFPQYVTLRSNKRARVVNWTWRRLLIINLLTNRKNQLTIFSTQFTF